MKKFIAGIALLIIAILAYGANVKIIFPPPNSFTCSKITGTDGNMIVTVDAPACATFVMVVGVLGNARVTCAPHVLP